MKHNMKKSAILAGILGILLAASTLFVNAETAPVPSEEHAVGGVCTVDGVTYFTDRYDRAVYTMDGDKVDLFIGKTDVLDRNGRPVSAYIDGSYEDVAFGEPCGIVPYRNGLLLADRENNALRYIDLSAKRVYTLAGSETPGLTDGKNANASFFEPTSVAVAKDGTVYVADTLNHAIRAVDADGSVTTFVGGEEGNTLGDIKDTRLSAPMGLCVTDDALYIADTGNHRIIMIKDGVSSLVTGATLTGDAAIEGDYLNGPAAVARFSSPSAVAVKDGVLYIADTANGVVRVLRDGYVTTVPQEAFTLQIVSPDTFFTLDDTLYIIDGFHRTYEALPALTPEIDYCDDDASPYVDAIRFVTANNLMLGTGDGKFSPDLGLTRGMFVTVLARYDGMDTTVGETWYEIGMQWATDNEISDGTNPENPITYEQMLTMLHRYIGLPTSTVTVPADLTDTADWARDAVAWAIDAGIVAKESAVDADRALTRGEITAILMSFLVNT